MSPVLPPEVPTVLANGIPSGRIHPWAEPRRLFAVTVDVASHATCTCRAALRLEAAVAHMLSAPASPPMFPVVPAWVTKMMLFAVAL